VATAKKKAPPKVRARSRAMTGGLMTTIEERVLEKNPGMKLRWIFSPEHDQKHSQIWRREIEGYTLVDPETEGLELPHGKVGNRVQVGDLVLMMVPEDVRAERDAEVAETAKNEASRSREAYYESMKSLRTGKHEGRPSGDIKDSEDYVTPKNYSEET
jgi:hypothetical protein